MKGGGERAGDAGEENEIGGENLMSLRAHLASNGS